VIEPQQVAVGVVAGLTLLVFGFAPRYLDAVADGIQNFQQWISGKPPIAPHLRPIGERPVHIWMVVCGSALIALTLIAYTSN
jgi:hypothetical protein